MPLTVCNLYNYPMKGLSPQPLPHVRLTRGQGFPFDRIYGLARHDSGYDPANYKPLPKTRFIVLVKEERLAGLATFFDHRTGRLEVRVQGQLVLDESLETAEGRENVSRFFSNMFDLNGGQEPMVAVAGSNRFTDVSVHSESLMNAISLMNLDSIQHLEARTNAVINPLRFRANLYFTGLEPFQELEMLDREVTVGSTRLRIVRRTRRCAATDVDPVTAERDMAIPRSLMRLFGHTDLGVYAEVLEGGTVEVGSAMSFA